MPYEILSLLPDLLLRCPLGMAGLLAAFGAIVWICGARFSRSIIALSAVALGTMIGMRLPAWRGWQIDGMGVAVGGAVVLGTVAFLFHRTCIGLLLGGGMLLWAGTATWLFLGKGATWDLQAVHWDGDLVQFLRLAWQALPPGLSRVFPAACFAGLAGGITMAVIFPKLSKVLTHSLTGVTLMAVMGAVLLQAKRPMWISALPGSILAQGIVLIGIVLLGVIMQWQITPPYRNAGSNATRKS